MSHSIESNDKSVADLLADFYVVPDYQREYVWEDEQIEQLFDDIHAEFASGENPLPDYFIGSIVVCRSTDGRFELIDGQQRLTTLYVLLCAIRDHLQARNVVVPGQLGALVSAHGIDADGNDVYHHRVELQYEDSGDTLVAIAEGRLEGEVAENAVTRSIANLRNAYDLSRDFLGSQFVDDDQGVKRFLAYLTQKVKLIRIGTQSVAHALKIFETINDRGKGLDSMDLLKNLMFMQVGAGDFAKLKDRWKKLVDTLYDAGEKPLRFLRYFIFATYDVERLKEEEIYGWFVKNRQLCGYEAKPLQFVEKLLKAAEAYQLFSRGQDPSGASNRYLQNIRLLSGAARQHFILLLAGRHLSPALFAKLARQLENLLFVFVITRENTREFERKFAQWATALAEISDEVELDAWFESRITPEKRRLATRFELTLRELDLSLLQKYRQRYLLAKLTQHVDEQAFGVGTQSHLDAYLNRDVHIEHIFPQSPSDAALAEFGVPASAARLFVNKLGNLALAERPLNTSLGNKPYSVKRPVYPKSRFLLTRTIGAKVVVGANTTVNKAVTGFEPFESWTPRSVQQRQAMLTKLAHRVWEVPRSGAASSSASVEEDVESDPRSGLVQAISDVISGAVPAWLRGKTHTAPSTSDAGESEVERDRSGVIVNAHALSADEVAMQRVLCPACEKKVFESWPGGWDSHAGHACTGVLASTETERKAEFRRRYEHLFKDDGVRAAPSRQRDVMRRLWVRFAGDEARTIQAYAEAESRGEVARSRNA